MCAKPSRPLNPAALSADELAKILSSAGGKRVSVAQVRALVKRGAPTDGKGRFHLVHVTAWLAGQVP